MQIKCPVCHNPVQIADHHTASHAVQCPSCRKNFFLAGDLAFRYGIQLPPSETSRYRVACPYCNQHYNLTTPPMYNLLGCMKCLKHFILPCPPSPAASVPLQNTAQVPQRNTIPGPATPAPSRIVQTDEKISAVPAQPQSITRQLAPVPLAVPKVPQQDMPPATENSNVLAGKFPPPLQLKQISPSAPTARIKVEPKEPAEVTPPRVRMTVPRQRVSPAMGNNTVAPPPPFFQDSTQSSGNYSGQEKTEEPDGMPQNEPDQKIRRLTGNILWLFLGGLVTAVITTIYGCIFCITVIGIPLGLQLFKVAKLYLSPFGAEIRTANDQQVGCLATGGNILWILLGGWLTALGNLLIGGLLFCTVIGIPFAMQYFKLAKLVLAPFGKEVRWKANIKELITCILIVFLLEFVILPAVTSVIRKAVVNAVIRTEKKYSAPSAGEERPSFNRHLSVPDIEEE